MPLDPFLIVLIALLLIGGAIVRTLWYSQRALVLAEQWARHSRRELLEFRPCWLWWGPFWWRRFGDHVVARIMVRTRAGDDRSGWMRCGGRYLGFSNRGVEVVWEPPGDQPAG